MRYFYEMACIAGFAVYLLLWPPWLAIVVQLRFAIERCSFSFFFFLLLSFSYGRHPQTSLQSCGHRRNTADMEIQVYNMCMVPTRSALLGDFLFKVFEFLAILWRCSSASERVGEAHRFTGRTASSSGLFFGSFCQRVFGIWWKFPKIAAPNIIPW